MAATSVSAALRYIRTLFAGKKAEGESDQYLLEQFVAQHDQAAFAALLQRHGPMAMGVCMRILNDEHLAEDALQATFLVLALKAGAIRKRASVASWLHGVALRLARKVKGQACRAQHPVQRELPEPPAASPLEASRREEKKLLDEELERLPEKYRLPLLLCYFEGRTQEEAAAQLGWTPGQVKGLLDRGRERLRFRLMRRGVTLSVAASATLLADTALSAAVPLSLAAPTVKAGVNLVSGKTLAECGVSASVATLVKGGLIMGPKKIVLILAIVFLTGTIAVAAGIWAQNARNPDGDDPGRGLEQVAIEQKGDGKAKDGQKKNDADAEAEDAVIGRLIEILKNPAMSDEERVLACEALGKRGSKAKRALPEIAKFFGATEGDKDFEAKLKAEQLMKVMVAAAAIAPKSQENFKILTTALRHANDQSIRIEALDALGRIGANSQKTFDLLLESTKADRLKEKGPPQQSLRIAAVGALANLGATSNKDFKLKAKLELQLLSETEIDTRVREAARAGLVTMEGTVAAAPDEDLAPNPSSMDVLLDNDGNGEGKFTFQRGSVDGFTAKVSTGNLTTADLKEMGFTVETAGQEVKVIARGAKPTPLVIIPLDVAAKGGKKGARLMVVAMYAPLTLSGLKDGMIKSKAPSEGKPLKLEMKIAMGRAESVQFIGAKVEPEVFFSLDNPRFKGKPEQLRKFRAEGLVVTLNEHGRRPIKGGGSVFVQMAGQVSVTGAATGPQLMALTVGLSEDKSAVIVTCGQIGFDTPIPGAYDVWVHGKDAGGRDSSTRFSVILTK